MLAALLDHHGGAVPPQSQLKLDKPNQISASGKDSNADNFDWFL
jgi:hypothetical protein